MSSRIAMRSVQSLRFCAQSMRVAPKRVYTVSFASIFFRFSAQSIRQMPESQLRSVLKMNQLKCVNKKMNQFATFAKMNKAEVAQISLFHVVPANASGHDDHHYVEYVKHFAESRGCHQCVSCYRGGGRGI